MFNPDRITSFKNGDNDMISTKRTAGIEGDKHMNTKNLIRWAGLAAMGAGILLIVIQMIQPLDVLASVITVQWAIAHYVGVTMCLLGLFGITGLYARQAQAAGWLGLVGYLLLILFYAFTLAFQSAEAVILPLWATEAPTFVTGWLTIPNGHASAINLGVLPAIYMLTGIGGYVLGGLLFGIATFRAGILSRWAAGLLAFAAVSPLLLTSLLPHPLDRILAVPMEVALVWLGYALWSERRETATEPVPGRASPQLRQTAAE